MGKPEKTNFLTEQGVKELKKELDYLINIKRPENIQALKEARALGDLSENAEYDAARTEQAQIEAKIVELEATLGNVTIIKNKKTDEVAIGATVTIEYVDDKEQEEYQIVGSKEANPDQNKISNESPIAKAILDKKVNDIVTVESPNGTYDIKIKKIA